jgi:hypothetical protein
MPEVKVYTVYKFDELSESAKDKARDWYRGFDSDFDNEFVFDDAVRVGALMGIEIATRSVRLYGGGFGTSPVIYYSGFSSQGDGACFEGSYRYVKGALKALRKEIGSESKGDKELLRIATALQAIQRKAFYGLTATMSHRGHYYHSGCMAVSVEDRTGYEVGGDFEETIVQLMRDFADWIYNQLEAEYWFRQSDAQVDESIRANEYTFDEDGKRED